MQRDFMGMEETRGSLGTSCVHRPLPTKASPFQQFMPFKTELSSNTLHQTINIDAHHNMLSQKCVAIGKQPLHPYAFQGYPSQGSNRYDIPINQPNPHLSSNPHIAFGANYFRAHQALTISRQQDALGRDLGFTPPVLNRTDGTFLPRDISSQFRGTPQLTIFYGGNVNVYDNVPLDKAQEIMLMAANVSNANNSLVNLRNQMKTQVTVHGPSKQLAPGPLKSIAIPPKTTTALPRSSFSSPNSVASHSAAQSASSSSTLEDRKEHEPRKMLVNEDMPSPSSTSTTKVTSVPMMRKLSLARFLEKRKERSTSLSPYLSLVDLNKSATPSHAKPEIGGSARGTGWSWQSNSAKSSSDGKDILINTKLGI